MESRRRIAILIVVCCGLMGQDHNIPFVARPYKNTAEDFTAGAACKGAWIMGGTTQAGLFLDRCDSSSGPDQGGADPLALAGSENGETCVNEDAETPFGTSTGDYSIDTFQDDPKFCFMEGPDADETEFESDDFSAGCWARGDHSGGVHNLMAWGLITTVQFVLQDTVSTTGSYANMNAPSGSTLFSPSTSGPVYAQNVWRFHAMTRVSTGKFILYHSDSDDSSSLLGCDGDGTLSSTACNTGFTDTVDFGSSAELTIGQSGASPYTGNFFECFFMAEVLTAADMCSICRCGFEGQNSGNTADRTTFCNNCTLPSSASNCGSI